MRPASQRIAPECVSLARAPWEDRPPDFMAHPCLAAVGQVNQTHLAVGVVRVATVTAGGIEALERTMTEDHQP